MPKKTNETKSYLVFARKFRPQVFDEIIGQETIVSTLKNAITQERVPQSFLFTGTRGVGKTSAARILAKSLNCEKGPTVTPCGQCSSCTEVTKGSSLDVIEIDGASNNSVDNIRDLRESIAMRPVDGRFKIYIIDEVHMLSQGAFNALLKTLEEPPQHAKFVFATTDFQKVPATIVSRCQRFQFRRVPTQDIISKLKVIAKQEKIEAEPEALALIAKAAEGSLRDAESLLDQTSNFSKGKIKTEDIEKALGLASYALTISLLKAWGKKDAGLALEIVEKALEQGIEIVPFTKGLYEMTRNFLIAQVHPNPKGLIDLTPELIQEIKKEAEAFSEDGLLALLKGLEKLIQTVQYSPAARFALEAAVVRLSNVSDALSVQTLLDRIEKFEKKTKFPQSSSPSSTSPESQAAPARPSLTKTAPADAPEAPSSSFSFDLNTIEKIWPQVIQEAEEEKISLGPPLREAEPIAIEEGCLILGFPEEFKFYKEILEEEATKSLLQGLLQKQLGSSLAVKAILRQPDTVSSAKQTIDEPANREVPSIVESALSDVFKDGRIVRHD